MSELMQLKLCPDIKYMNRSFGIHSISSAKTLMPPIPESKTPIGLDICSVFMHSPAYNESIMGIILFLIEGIIKKKRRMRRFD